MAKSVNLLSDIQIKAWIAKGAPVARSDGDGLTFTLSAAGTASWVLRYRFGARRRELTIGNYPDISLATAREKARAHRAAVDEGRDPGAEKLQGKSRARSALLVSELAADFREKVLLPSKYSRNTIIGVNFDLDSIILPRLGAWRVDQVSAIDIVSMITASNRTWSVSKRILTTAGQLFDHAVGQAIISLNPRAGIRLSAIKGPRPPVRQRVMLTRDELRRLLSNDIEFIGLENSYALLILLATCVRGIELVRAKKEHLDLERGFWWVPEESVKTRRGFLVPLVPAVVEWFRALIELSGESEYILPARHERRRRNKGGDTHVGETTLWAAIRRAFERNEISIRSFTPHDTRSTAKGHMRNLGISREISEIALNHVLKGMEGIYDVREEIPERRVALEKWANFLLDCKNLQEEPPSNVIQFPRRA